MVAYIFDFILNLVVFTGYLRLLQNELCLIYTLQLSFKLGNLSYFQKILHLAQVFKVPVAQCFLTDP